jgi:hypothetical protein
LGVSYEAQATDALGAANNWTTFTNVVGTGLEARVSDTNALPAAGFYRVVTP